MITWDNICKDRCIGSLWNKALLLEGKNDKQSYYESQHNLQLLHSGANGLQCKSYIFCNVVEWQFDDGITERFLCNGDNRIINE